MGKKKKDESDDNFVNPMLSDSDEEDGTEGDPTSPNAAASKGASKDASKGESFRAVEDEDGQEVLETPERFMAASGGTIRFKSSMDSEEIGKLKKGQCITVTHSKVVDGTTRLRFDRGWISQLNSAGYTLMVSENNENTHWRAIDDCTVRVGSHKDTDKAAVLPKGKVIEATAGVELKIGGTTKKCYRLQFKTAAGASGWTSNMSGKAKPLLEEVVYKDVAGKAAKEAVVKEMQAVVRNLSAASSKLSEATWMVAGLDVRQKSVLDVAVAGLQSRIDSLSLKVTKTETKIALEKMGPAGDSKKKKDEKPAASSKKADAKKKDAAKKAEKASANPKKEDAAKAAGGKGKADDEPKVESESEPEPEAEPEAEPEEEEEEKEEEEKEEDDEEPPPETEAEPEAEAEAEAE